MRRFFGPSPIRHRIVGKWIKNRKKSIPNSATWDGWSLFDRFGWAKYLLASTLFYGKNTYLSTCCKRPKHLLGHSKAIQGLVLALLGMTQCFVRCPVHRNFFHERLSYPARSTHVHKQIALPRAVITQKQEVHSPESDLDLQREKQ